ncbi:hypothetical protein ABIC65_001484 [Sphingomonas trueperi]|uniref:hypothetical protein n=1 Tax=Sphingomonas trueperi TaxID=53317 RepID=UPI00339B678D
MIRYDKCAAVPSSLRRGVAATNANCAAFDDDPAAYRSGERDFDITSKIYGTAIVKRHLKADQHDKCGFCEAVFDANVAGDVEHFRPKAAVLTDSGRIYPGYYWLGYSWPNLSYACPDCNSYRKRDRFPLVLEDARAVDHHDDINYEEPLLLDPYGAADPREHIQFRGEAPIGRSPHGQATIDILALDRTTLARDRLLHLRQLSRLYESVELLKDDPRPEAIAYIARVRAQLAAAVGPAARFSAAAADHLAALAAGKNYLPEETPT